MRLVRRRRKGEAPFRQPAAGCAISNVADCFWPLTLLYMDLCIQRGRASLRAVGGVSDPEAALLDFGDW